MSALAIIRPDDWNLPLFLHVLSALVLIGAVALVLIWLAGAWRAGSAPNTRLAFRTLLWAVIPAWIVMRLTAEWLLDKQGLEDAELDWIEIGFITAEPTFVLLLIATVIAGLRARAMAAGATGPSIGGRIAAGLVSVCLLAYLVALWAMTTKPT
jgi:uncharacterized membrane protein YeaQ/YmgE (transglycosylase-associated protein family)